VSQRWPRYEVVFPDHARTLEGGYASIASGDFARVLEAALGPALCLRARVANVSPTRVELAGGEVLHAGAVIDGRGMRASSRLALGWQTFLGQEVLLAEPTACAPPSSWTPAWSSRAATASSTCCPSTATAC
jgi:lycopene beta-cyclase